MTPEAKSISILANKNLQNYWFIAYIRGLLQKKDNDQEDKMLNVYVYWVQGDLHLSEELEEAVVRSPVVIALMPLKRNAMASIHQLLADHQRILYQFCTFGEEIDEGISYPRIAPNVVSEGTPLGRMPGLLESLKGIYNNKESLEYSEQWNYKLGNAVDKLPPALKRVEKYNDYIFEEEEKGKLGTMSLVELGNFYGTNLKMEHQVGDDREGFPMFEFTTSDYALYSQYKPVSDVLHANRYDYLKRALKTAQVRLVPIQDKMVAVALVYAEQYTNEVAHQLIQHYNENNVDKVLVLVAKHTKGNDMYALRGSNIDVGEIARALGGQGKPQAGSVFLPSAKEAVFNSLIEELEEI